MKQQYWLYVSMQKQRNQVGSVRLYPVQLPEQRIDGVTFQPSSKYLRIEECSHPDQASLTSSERLTNSPDLHNDLPLGPALFKIRQRRLRLIERKYLINHRSDAPRLEQFTDLCELPTIWMHEQE